MIPLTTAPKNIVDEFIHTLHHDNLFQGEVSTRNSDRVVYATDNSLFEVTPLGVIFPKTEKDLGLILSLLSEDSFRQVSITARGGGTSTNGQSLSHQLIVDTSKYMNHILAVNPQAKSVRLESGVILDQLNHHLADHGLMFGPTTSSSSRVTLGGMIATDASGIGSMVWGKTSDHIRSLRVVLIGGEIIDLHHNRSCDHPIMTQLEELLCQYQKTFQQIVPHLPRFFSGYNLNCFTANHLNLTRLMAGSEGTLGIVSECTLNLIARPTHETLFVCFFRSIESCLRVAKDFTNFSPLAMELIDEHILAVATTNDHMSRLPLFRGDHVRKGACALFVSFKDHEPTQYHGEVQSFQRHLNKVCHDTTLYSYFAADHPSEIENLWNIRKKSVGLFAYRARLQSQNQLRMTSNNPDKALTTPKGSAFIEDCAVHPDHVGDFIRDFRKLLDQEGITYGMYGHLDAGCVHVRPQLDWHDPQMRQKIKELTDRTFKLTQKYGGVLWGEHGKGYRSEYLREFLGEDLYLAFCHIKELFDPHNQLNPGTICPPFTQLNTAGDVPSFTLIPLRADKERMISPRLSRFFFSALSCDGNGVCFQEKTHEVMCPSYIATRNRVHSPKGRATLLRGWLYELSQDPKLTAPLTRALDHQSFHFTDFWSQFSPRLKTKQPDFANEVYQAFAGCLMCKGCSSGCPLHVDIPELKSRFLYLYHRFHPRSVRDYFLALAEITLPFIASFWLLRTCYNQLIRITPVRYLLKQATQMSDFPVLYNGKKRWSQLSYTPSAIEGDGTNQVVIIQDLVSSYFSQDLLHHIIRILSSIGIKVCVHPYYQSGKSLHSMGFLSAFQKIARRNLTRLTELTKAHPKITFVGIDPGLACVYRKEYRSLKATTSQEHSTNSPTVLLLQEYLVSPQLAHHTRKQLADQSKNHRVFLFLHCFERSTVPGAAQNWLIFFKSFGITIHHQPVGCCGLAGFWGHKIENNLLSQKVFQSSWQLALDQIYAHNQDGKVIILATGGSCREQIALRFTPKEGCPSTVRVYHPIEYLATMI
ncbi:MAG: FAD-binding and (Fe-S)-binding domain-containing protein [Proteobacteria bacterium]|nr:FAD-binding and (Fe-S)-binding domain-containing protein [Pseudomonadota bacterium]